MKFNDCKINFLEELVEVFNNYFINIGFSLVYEMVYLSVLFESFVKLFYFELLEFRIVINVNV